MTKVHRVQPHQALPGAAAPAVRAAAACQAVGRREASLGAATWLLAGQVLPALADVEQDVPVLAAVADAEVASSSASTSSAVAGGKQVCCENGDLS